MSKLEYEQPYPLIPENGDLDDLQQELRRSRLRVGDSNPELSLQQRRIAEYRALRDGYQREHPDVLNNPFEDTLRGLEAGTLIAEN